MESRQDSRTLSHIPAVDIRRGVGENAPAEGVVFASYKPSGRFGSAALVRLAVAAVLAVALALPYQRIVFALSHFGPPEEGRLTPLVLPFPVGFGLLLGALARYVTRTGKSRSLTLDVGIVVVLVAAAWGASFAWDRALLEETLSNGSIDATDLPEPARRVHRALPDGRPAEGLSLADYVEVKSWMGWSGRTLYLELTRPAANLRIRGPLVWCVWALEGGILAVLAWRRARLGEQPPFCESCGLWTEPNVLRDAVGVLPDDLERAVDGGDLAALVEPVTGSVVPSVVSYVLHECPQCRGGGWLDVSFVRVRTGRWGKTRLVTTPLVRGVVLGPEDRHLVLAARRNPNPLEPCL